MQCSKSPAIRYWRLLRDHAGRLYHSDLLPQPIGNSAGDLRRRLVRDRKHRTDVDLAEHVAVGPVAAGGAKHEVRVPDHRQVAPRDVQHGGQLRRPYVFHQPAQALEARVDVAGVEPPSGLGARGRCIEQGLDLLKAEADAAIACHVAAHYTFAQARLEWLIDHAAVFETLDTPLDKLVQRELLRCVLGGIQHAHHRPVVRTCQRLHLPDALAAVAAVALDHARANGEPRRQFDAHRLGRSIEGRVAAPTHRAGTMEHLLGAHLEDHVGMGAHPGAACHDLAQQRVEIDAVAPLVNRVDPDEHAIERGELCARGIEDIVLVDYRFRIDADIGERREDGLEPAGLWRGAAARRFIAAPEDSDAAEASCGLRYGKRLHVHDRAPARASARTASRTWTG